MQCNMFPVSQVHLHNEKSQMKGDDELHCLINIKYRRWTFSMWIRGIWINLKFKWWMWIHFPFFYRHFPFTSAWNGERILYSSRKNKNDCHGWKNKKPFRKYNNVPIVQVIYDMLQRYIRKKSTKEHFNYFSFRVRLLFTM